MNLKQDRDRPTDTMAKDFDMKKRVKMDMVENTMNGQSTADETSAGLTQTNRNLCTPAST